MSNLHVLPTIKAETYRQIPSGFSLVELLVVLLIIGLGISLVSVNVGGSDGQLLRLEAKQFANNTSLIAEEAVLSNRQWGVDIYRHIDGDVEQLGYRWLIRNEDGDWQLAVDDRRPVEFLFSPIINIRLTLEGSDQFVEIVNKRDIDEAEPVLIDQPVKNGLSIVEQLEADNPQEPVQPALWLLSSGEMSAFVMELFLNDDTDNKVVVIGDELGRITLQRPEVDDNE